MKLKELLKGTVQSAVKGAAPVEDTQTIRARARDRALQIGLLVFLAYAALVVRAVPLMLLPDDKLQAKAAIQFHKSVELETPRGDVLSRDGGVLATSVEMPSLHADPSRLSGLTPDELSTLVDRLAELLEVPSDRLMERLSNGRRRDVVLSGRLSPDLLPAVEVLDPNKAFFTQDSYVRYYPSRGLAAQVLGAVGWNGDGIAGVEQQLNSKLRGTTYKVVRQRDLKGKSLTPGNDMRDHVPAGDTVVLTIDRYIQQITEEALDRIVEKSKPLSATAIVMDVATGEILALANRPTINLNKLARDTSRLQNYAVSYAYEPGSVIKPFIMAEALEQGVVSPTSSMDCEGGRWKLGRSTINDDHPHDVVTVTEVIKYSSNICSAKLGIKLGGERVMGGLRRFGFASRTGVTLPSEAPGALRSPKTVKPIELATTTYGQGMTSNLIQLASAAATIANHGTRMQPYLVSEIRDRRGNPKMVRSPQKAEQAVSPETADIVLAMMETVLEPKGTGTRARIPGYTAAGKTGTAQKVEEGRYSPTARVATFMGVAPAKNPRIAIVVLTDSPTEGSRYGGTVSGPAFSYIGERALRYLGVAPDRIEDEEHLFDEPMGFDEDVESEDEEASDGEVIPSLEPVLVRAGDGGFVLPDLSGLSMRDALVTLDGAGLELAVLGSGMVFEQSPAAGGVVHIGDRIEVKLQ